MKLITLLVSFLLLQDPKPVTVEGWIERLSDAKAETQAEATAELEKLGDKASAPLRKVHEGAADAGLKERAAAILMKIDVPFRREHFDGGAEVCGLKLRLAVAAKEVKKGAVVKFTVELMDVAADARPFIAPRMINIDLPEYSMRSPSAEWLVIKAVRVKGKAKKNMCEGIGCGPPPHKQTQTLESGGSWKDECTVRTGDPDSGEIQLLTPGEYDVTATYGAKSSDLIVGAKADIVSKTIRVKVTE